MEQKKQVSFIAESQRKLEPVIKVRRSTTLEKESFGFEGLVTPPVDFYEIAETAMSNGYHNRCINIKAQNIIANLKMSETEKRWFEDRIEDDTFENWLLGLLIYYFFFGNSYIETEKTRSGKLAGLHVVPSQTMFCTVEGDIKGFVQITNYKRIPFVPFGTGDSNEIMHLKKKNILSDFYGFPEWIPAIESLRIDQNVKIFNSSFFNNSAKPDIAVILEGAQFSPEAKKEIKDGLRQTKGADKAHKTMVISVPFEGAKVKFEKIDPNIKDWDFEKITKAGRDEIIAAHGVPPRLLGIVTAGQLGGGSEGENQMDIFYETVIRPEGNYIAGKLNRLLQEGGLPGNVKLVLPGSEKELSDADKVEKSTGNKKNFEDIFWR